MTPETHDLFRGIVSADAVTVQQALVSGADVNATDEVGRNVVSYAALGTAIDAIDTAIQPRLSERRLDVLQLVTQQAELSLYSLNAPMAWAGGVTLLGLMSWLNMPSEIMCLLDFTQGLLEVNAMDEQGATPLMYAARDGNLQVVQRLLAHGARPDLKDVSQRSAIQYALPHPQILWLCEESLRHSREFESVAPPSKDKFRRIKSSHRKIDRLAESLFFSPHTHRLLTPPPMAWFDVMELRRTFDTLQRAIRSDDLDALNTVLFSQSSSSNTRGPEQYPNTSTSPRVSFLVNFRDNTGLTLVHHAVSQRPYPRIAVLDALYSAGSDVGLFSTLGFTPLHHLARTARDDSKGVIDEKVYSNASPAVHMHPMYAFTMHIVRDLHAPLGATDNKGETPLHAAAEHGHSLSVLQAMLDCDKEFSGKEAVREARNERGLRPVDLARPEFLPLFLAGHQGSASVPSRSQPPTLLPLGDDQVQGALAYGSPHSFRPGSASIRLAKKESNASLTSRSSGSSSTSSGTHSYGSYWAHATHRSHRSHHWLKPVTPIHALPTPDPTPPGSFAGSPPSVHDPYASIDVPACALDILYNLSFCASALHAYAQPHSSMYEMDTSTVPDLPSLSDTLLFTRDLSSHVLEHWAARLETAREEFDRARRELGKAEVLRSRVGRDVKLIMGRPNRHRRSETARTLVGTRLQPAGLGGLLKHAAVQTELDIPGDFCDMHLQASPVIVTESSGANGEATAMQSDAMSDIEREQTARTVRVSMYTRMEEEGLQEHVTPENHAALKILMKQRRAEEDKIKEVEDEERVSRWYTGEDDKRENKNAVLSGSIRREPLRFELTHELNEESCAVGRDARAPTSVRFPDVAEKPEPLSSQHNMDDSVAWLQNAPRVLQRADQDLHDVIAHFALVQQSFIRAQQCIAQARVLAEEAIKCREDQLNVLIRLHHRQDLLTQSSRLSPILERSSDAGLHKLGTSPFLYEPSSPASAVDPRHATALGHLEEPHLLRRLLTRKLAKYVEGVFNDLQKALVWLRIVREVLRGLRRRAFIEQ